MNVGELIAKIKTDNVKLKKGLREAETEFKRSSGKMGKMIDGLGQNWLGLTVGITGFSAAVGMAFRHVIKSASEAEETFGKFSTVFADFPDASQWADDIADSFFMSRTEAQFFLGSLQDLFVPMGVAAEKAAELSRESVKLAADLGSFNNLTTAQVMEDLTSAFVGNYETMKKYGIRMLDSTVQQKALEMGLAATKKELTAAHKAMAAYQIVVEGSDFAIGDMNRTQASFANQSKRLVSLLKNLSDQIGNYVLPYATKVVTKFNEWLATNERMLVQKIGEWMKGMARAIVWVGRAALTAHGYLDTFANTVVKLLGLNPPQTDPVITRINELKKSVQGLDELIGSQEKWVKTITIKGIVEWPSEEQYLENLKAQRRAAQAELDALEKGYGKLIGAVGRADGVVNTFGNSLGYLAAKGKAAGEGLGAATGGAGKLNEQLKELRSNLETQMLESFATEWGVGVEGAQAFFDVMDSGLITMEDAQQAINLIVMGYRDQEEILGQLVGRNADFLTGIYGIGEAYIRSNRLMMEFAANTESVGKGLLKIAEDSETMRQQLEHDFRIIDQRIGDGTEWQIAEADRRAQAWRDSNADVKTDTLLSWGEIKQSAKGLVVGVVGEWDSLTDMWGGIMDGLKAKAAGIAAEIVWALGEWLVKSLLKKWQGLEGGFDLSSLFGGGSSGGGGFDLSSIFSGAGSEAGQNFTNGFGDWVAGIGTQQAGQQGLSEAAMALGDYGGWAGTGEGAGFAFSEGLMSGIGSYVLPAAFWAMAAHNAIKIYGAMTAPGGMFGGPSLGEQQLGELNDFYDKLKGAIIKKREELQAAIDADDLDLAATLQSDLDAMNRDLNNALRVAEHNLTAISESFFTMQDRLDDAWGRTDRTMLAGDNYDAGLEREMLDALVPSDLGNMLTRRFGEQINDVEWARVQNSMMEGWAGVKSGRYDMDEFTDYAVAFQTQYSGDIPIEQFIKFLEGTGVDQETIDQIVGRIEASDHLSAALEEGLDPAEVLTAMVDTGLPPDETMAQAINEGFTPSEVLQAMIDNGMEPSETLLAEMAEGLGVGEEFQMLMAQGMDPSEAFLAAMQNGLTADDDLKAKFKKGFKMSKKFMDAYGLGMGAENNFNGGYGDFRMGHDWEDTISVIWSAAPDRGESAAPGPNDPRQRINSYPAAGAARAYEARTIDLGAGYANTVDQGLQRVTFLMDGSVMDQRIVSRSRDVVLRAEEKRKIGHVIRRDTL